MQKSTNKKKVIIDYKNVTSEILELFTEKYPYGYEEDIIKFQNSKGETVTTVPIETSDTKYLIKVGMEMDRKIDAFLEEDDDVKSETTPEAPDVTALED
jgi:hypothetical protein